MKEFLDYVETKKTTNNYTRQLDESVDKARMNKEWRVEYMKTLLHDMDVMASDLEEDEECISKIYDATISCAPDYDVDMIYKK